MNTEKLNGIMSANFDFLAAMVNVNTDFGCVHDDDDIEMVSNRYNLTPEEADFILRIIESARYHANARAVKAAEVGSREAVKAIGCDWYSDTRLNIHEAIYNVVFKAEYKALAKIEEA